MRSTLQWMEEAKSVAIIGAGPEGGAFAAHLRHRGKDVLLYGHREHPGLTQEIKANDGVLAYEGMIAGRRTVKVTSLMSEAVAFSPFVILAVPASAHDTILGELKGLDLGKHAMLATPGNFFGRYADGKIWPFCVFETSTAPYACKIENGRLLVKDAKYDLEIGGMPGDAGEDLRNAIEDLLPRKPKWCANTLIVGLSNVGTVIHVVTALMTAVKDRNFHFYGGGAASPPVKKAILALDWARLVIARGYGEVLPGVTEAVEAYYRQGHQTLEDFAEKSKTHNMTKGTPADISKHRFITEDVPYVLVTWYQLGRALRRRTRELVKALRIIRTVIDMAWLATGVDYMKCGRGLRQLGLHRASRSQILAAFGEKGGRPDGVLLALSAPLAHL